MTTHMGRRDAIAAMTASAAGLAGISSLTRAGVLTNEQLGFNASRAEYELPDLPYGYADLEPHIDAQTMEIHHSKHHAGYVRGLNKALEMLHTIRWGKGDPGTIQHWQRQLAFHYGGHVNHALFWSGMSPKGGGKPSGSLKGAIDDAFGSYDKFAWHFTSAAKSVEGSGWGWLVYEPIAQTLLVMQMENQQKMLSAGLVPLLGVDVWEHAYYLKYQNRRGDYLDAFMNVIDWGEIQRRFDAASA